VDPADLTPTKNDTCATATITETLKDSPASSVTIGGTLHSLADEDWYGFEAVDVAQAAGANSFRVNIEFLATGNPSNEFLFDVTRGELGLACSSTGAAKTKLTNYDWCAKQGNEGADANQTRPFRLRVYRNPAATPTCNQYRIRISNGGTGACPAPNACGAT